MKVIVRGHLDPLDYLASDDLASPLRRGDLIEVPLRKQTRIGVVIDAAPPPEDHAFSLKPINRLLEAPPLPLPLIDTLLFAATYYHVPVGELFALALPPEDRAGATRFCISDAGKTTELTEKESLIVAWAKEKRRGFTLKALSGHLEMRPESTRRHLNKLLQDGVIEAIVQSKASTVGAYRLAVHRTSIADDLTPKQRRITDALSETELRTVAQLGVPSPHHALKKLVSLEIVERQLVERTQAAYGESTTEADDAPELTDEQTQCLQHLIAELAQAQPQPALLHGVTGSGKTEVYLRLIETVLEEGKNALVLVPEIALTPQLGARFRARFGNQVATFHSGLTTAERRTEWNRIAREEVRIALGARSALFLPLTRIGAIVVDEEHDGSFKQDESPRYQARDLAVLRGKNEGAIVVLGSATPALETHHNAQQGRYGKLSMQRRVQNRPLPQVRLLDSLENPPDDESGVSSAMQDALAETLQRGEQALLFLNRRGYAPYIFCRDCGHSYKCRSCDVSLTLHRKQDHLQCHYCGLVEPVSDACPSCDSHRLATGGMGTERVESWVQSEFHDVPVGRMDRDAVKNRRDLERLLERFGRQELQVLVGTQMLAKGHDFPNVTFVGVLHADAMLHFPDFRAAERAFQLLTQVAGRAGRGTKPGTVCVQSFDVDHHAVRCAADQDYAAFSQIELGFRETFRYPPFCHVAAVRYEAAESGAAMQDAKAAGNRLRNEAPPGIEILGPTYAPLARLRGMERVVMMLKSPTRAALMKMAKILPRPTPGVRRVWDMDPYNML